MDPLSIIKCQEFVYQESTLSRELLQSFNEFREEGTLTDVEVNVENESFKCHKLILAASSPYYRALFKHDPHAHQSSKLSFPNTSPAVFREILEFMYTSKLTITAENVMEVLELADFLQFRDVVKCCCNILLQHIDVNNAITILQLAEAHLCQPLAHAAKMFIKTNFTDVMETQSFIKLSFDSLSNFLSDRTTVIRSEEKLLKSLCVWIDRNLEERKRYMESLFEFVHFDDISKEQKTESQQLFPFLQSFVEELEVAKSIDQMIKDDDGNGEGAENMNRPSKGVVLMPENINRQGPREKLILLYNQKDGKWSQLSAIPQDGTVSLQKMATVDNCIYVTGGEVNGIPTNRVLKYDVAADTWTKCAPMNRARFNHGLTEAMGYLYAFGGDADGVNMDEEFGTINTLERYNPQTDQWDMLEPLDSVAPESRARVHSRFTLANFDLVHVGDFLYVIGGTKSTRSWIRRRVTDAPRTPGETSMSRHNNVEIYHLETNSWSCDSWLITELTQHNMKLHSGTCYPYSGLLLLIDEDNRGKKMKLYNPVTHKLWDFLPTHGQHRFGGYLIQDNSLYAIGGMSSIRGLLQGHDLVHRTSLNNFCDIPKWEMLDPLPFALSHYKAFGVLK